MCLSACAEGPDELAQDTLVDAGIDASEPVADAMTSVDAMVTQPDAAADASTQGPKDATAGGDATCQAADATVFLGVVIITAPDATCTP